MLYPGAAFGCPDPTDLGHNRYVVEVLRPSDPTLGEWWCLVFSRSHPDGEEQSIPETQLTPAWLEPLTPTEAAERKSVLRSVRI